MKAKDMFPKLAANVVSPWRSTEWAERKGLLEVVAFFASGVAGGAWLVSLYFYESGLLISLLIGLIVGGGGHLLVLGRPLRFWRMIVRPQSSWVSRGLIGIGIFSLAGILYLIPLYFSGMPWTASTPFGNAMLVLSVVGAIWMFTYSGFAFSFARGIASWNTPVLPLLHIVCGLRGGSGLLLLIISISGSTVFEKLQIANFWAVVASAILVGVYLAWMNGSGINTKRSALIMIYGKESVAFYLGVVAVGMVIPLVWGAIGFTAPLSLVASGTIGAATVIGNFFIHYSVARSGIYLPFVSQTQRLRLSKEVI